MSELAKITQAWEKTMTEWDQLGREAAEAELLAGDVDNDYRRHMAREREKILHAAREAGERLTMQEVEDRAHSVGDGNDLADLKRETAAKLNAVKQRAAFLKAQHERQRTLFAAERDNAKGWEGVQPSWSPSW